MSAIFDTPFGLFGPLFLVFLLVVGVMVLAAIANVELPSVEFRRNANTTDSHAAERHGTATVEQIRNCIRNGGYMSSWFRADDNRYIDLCVLPNAKNGNQVDYTKWGLRVCGMSPCGEYYEITAFKQTGRPDEVYDYLTRKGYVEIAP